MFYIILVLIITVLVYFYCILKQTFKYWSDRKIKYIKPTFIKNGRLQIIPKDPFPILLQNWYNAFPDSRYHGAFQFLQPTLIIRDPELVKQITTKDFDHFVDHRNFVSNDVDPLWNRNLFARNGKEWRDMRAILSPSFTLSKMRALFHLIDEVALNFVKFYMNETKDGSIIELEMKDSLGRYTNDVIASAAFGVTVDSLRNRENDFFVTGKEMTDFSGYKMIRFFVSAISPTLSKLLKFRVIPTHLGDYFTAIIKDTIKARQEQNIVRNDMIQLLLDAKKEQEDNQMHHNEDDAPNTTNKTQITTDDIISQAMIFFLAGFETVSTVLAFAFYEIAVDSNVQTKLRAEIRNHTEKTTYESLSKLKYLDMVVSEVLRKWPAAVLTDRLVTKAYTIEPTSSDEVPLRLEEGMVCWLPMYAIQRDAKYFPNPEQFDPERFNDDNKGKIHPGAYIPFGIGPRMCIGNRFAILEMKLLIFYVIEKFELVAVERTKIPMVLDRKKANMSAEGGMWLGLKPLT